MITIDPSPRFIEALENLDSRKQALARNALKKFVTNHRLRGLKFERLKASGSLVVIRLRANQSAPTRNSVSAQTRNAKGAPMQSLLLTS